MLHLKKTGQLKDLSLLLLLIIQVEVAASFLTFLPAVELGSRQGELHEARLDATTFELKGSKNLRQALLSRGGAYIIKHYGFLI